MFEFEISLELKFDHKAVKDEVSKVINDILNGDDAKDYIKEDFYKDLIVDRFEVEKEAMRRISLVWDKAEISCMNNIDSYMTEDDIKMEIKSVVEGYVCELTDDLCYDMDISLRG